MSNLVFALIVSTHLADESSLDEAERKSACRGSSFFVIPFAASLRDLLAELQGDGPIPEMKDDALARRLQAALDAHGALGDL
jgi:hypothetical protein